MDNRYAPPQAEVMLPHQAEQELEVPEKVRKWIKHAWVAGLVSAAMTTVASVLGVAGFSIFNLLDAALVLGLTFGIYKKSRTCAVVMLVYFLVGRIMLLMETGQVHGLFGAIVFVYFYARGVQGTLAYHKLRKTTAD